MKHFMEPENVALIGISRKTGPGSFNLMENMIRFGFSGDIFPVNPHSTEILGRKTYPNIRDLKESVDLAVISTPRQTTLDILRDCAAVGVKAVIVVNQGFNDADSIGKALQKEMTRFARENGMRILGPNTLGVINCFNGFTTSFMPVFKERTPVGLICQSGIHFVGPRQFSGKIGKGIDLGNACDIGFYDALEYFGADPEIKVIAIHMEGLNQGTGFLAMARKVVREKPIVVHKVARSRSGAKAALTHTGSLSGPYEVFKGAMSQAGLTILEEASQMRDAVHTLLHLPTMRGDRVAVITYSGGAGIMGSDVLERYGLKLGSLSLKTIDAMAQLSPDWMPLSNPLDIWPAVMLHGAHKAYSVALKAVLDDPNVDGVVCIAIAPLPEFSFLDVSAALNRVLQESNLKKPVAAWLYGPNTDDISKAFEAKKRIMTYPTIEGAAWALSILRDRYKTILF
jgi:acetyltransferase